MYTSPQGHTCILIAIEGPDRVGKATQARLLEEALNKKKIRATTEEIPYNDKVTHPEIYRMLNDGSVNKEPVVFQTLQGINRRFFQAKFLPTLAGHYDVLVLDRWNLSTHVYGLASGVSMETTTAILTGIVEPDITFVLDGSPFPKNGLDVWEADTEFQKNIRSGYLSWCEKDPKNYVRIDASRPQTVVHEDIFMRVMGLLQ